MNPQIWAAVIAGCAALIGLPLTNYLAGRRDARAKEVAFKIDCYERFVNAYFGMAERSSFETQLELTKSVNLMALMANRGVLDAIHDLVDNRNSQDGAPERSWELLDKILYEMRRDTIGSADTIQAGYKFPVLVTDIAAPRHRRTKEKDT
ncbi:MAG TPA: hypothetical protein VLV86_16555 [Vicinamibacterales bacterium]|nr:hypothetical protein [Vicinamibacterales bacterium]